MAARNPTAFNTWNNEAGIAPRANVTTTVPSAVADDQIFFLDKEEIVISDMFQVQSYNSNSFTTSGYYKIDTKDMCSVSTVSNDEISHYLHVYAWVFDDGGPTTGEVRVTSTLASATASATATISSTTAGWVAGAAAFNVKTNGNEDTLTVEVRRTSLDNGIIYFAGIAIYAGET